MVRRFSFYSAGGAKYSAMEPVASRACRNVVCNRSRKTRDRVWNKSNDINGEAMMKKLTVALCALALLATGAQAQTVKDFMAAVMKKWTTPFEPFQVIGNIYYVGTDGIAVYVIKTSQELILMDTALPQSTGMIKDNIAKLGFKLGDIKYILNSHAHFDHTGGFAEIKQETGAQLVAGERDKPLLEGGYYPGDEKDTDLAFPPVKVDRAVKEGDQVTLGDTTLTAHSMPGHSPGCTSWEMTVKDAGQDRDVLFFCSGTVALNKLVGHPTHPGIVDDYRSTYAKAKAMAPKVDVLLGPHPEVYGMQAKREQMKDGAPNPFVKPGELGTYVAGLETDFDKALAKQTAAMEKAN
jgi:metallo-beta-lactamase class B